MKITMFVIRFTPAGIFSITAKVIAQQVQAGNNISEVISRLGLYFITVLTGLLIHGFITLPLSVKLIGKANPVKHFRNVITPLLTAFSTSSSNATLPLTMEAVEINDGVSNKIASFTIPLGATINMNGTALYECVAVMFIAQAYGVELTFAQQIIVIFTALLSAIGAAGIPMAGLVMMAVVLKAVGLPLEGIGLILAVDRILDMFRTSINVYGDTCCAVIIAKSEGEKLKI
jgi:proton glutamate symport protein